MYEVQDIVRDGTRVVIHYEVSTGDRRRRLSMWHLERVALVEVNIIHLKQGPDSGVINLLLRMIL